MKTILLLLGPNGVGKSTTAKHIVEKLPNTALVDSDWCRAMNPYDMDTVINNIYSLMSNYLHCTAVKTLILPYGFHGDRKKRYDAVINKLHEDGIDFTVFPVILMCSPEENISRAQNDMRDKERVQRGIENTFHFYDEYDCPKIDTTDINAQQAAERVISLLGERKNL